MFFKNKKVSVELQEHELPKDSYQPNADLIWMRRMISHNIRMPMSIIRGYSDVIRQDLLSPEDRKKALDTICENVMYLDQILSVIFDDGFSSEIIFTKVDVTEVIKKVTGYMTEISKKNNINIILNLDTPNTYVNAENIAFMRMFYQIYENSFKYLKNNSTIEIKTYLAGDDVLIVYKDDGAGVDDVARIFEKGFRGENSSGVIGSGYGLYEVSETVKRYNGNIEIKSGKGNGFSIYMTFPILK